MGKNSVFGGCVFIPRWRPLAAMGTNTTDGVRWVKASRIAAVWEASNNILGDREVVLDLFSGTGSVSREFQNMGTK